MIQAEELAHVFVEVADTLVSDFDLIEFMHTLTTHAADLTDTAAVGVLLADGEGVLHYMGSSSEEAHVLELFQIQHAEGPCLEAFRTGQRVVEQSMTGALERWPIFAPRALEAGIESVVAFPLRLRDTVIGALNVFGDRDPLSATDVVLVQALADLATIAIQQAKASDESSELNGQLQAALDRRVVIEQAKGVVSRTFGVSVHEAFNLMRQHARSRRMHVSDLAHMIIVMPTVADELNRGSK